MHKGREEKLLIQTFQQTLLRNVIQNNFFYNYLNQTIYFITNINSSSDNTIDALFFTVTFRTFIYC